jgi:hypothetical protein
MRLARIEIVKTERRGIGHGAEGFEGGMRKALKAESMEAQSWKLKVEDSKKTSRRL